MDIRHRILAIDDDSEILDFIKMSLRSKFEMITATSGREGLAKCKECQPDLVILDVMMPDLSGFEICQAIRRMQGKAYLPIIMFSALDSVEDHKSGYKEGASFYLTKPIPPDRLLRNVEIQLASAPPPIAKKLSLEQITSRKSWVEDKPVKVTSTPSAPAKIKVDIKSTHRPRILVVDDDPDLLHVLELIFAKNYEFLTSSNGMDALRKITAYEPDVLILDIIIPKVNGFQVCAAVRKLERLAGLPIIFLTGKDDPKLREMGEQYNALYIMKPVNPQVIIQKVKEQCTLSPYLDRPKRIPFSEIHKLEEETNAHKNAELPTSEKWVD
jgi:DNA-binding response OmpR family regulator